MSGRKEEHIYRITWLSVKYLYESTDSRENYEVKKLTIIS